MNCLEKYPSIGCDSADTAKVSLIVPMYCCEDYANDLLNNLCGQDYHDIEIICVVDGSPDRTYDIVAEHAQKDTRIKLFNCEHKGAGAARNFGMSKASGEYLIFLDADDEYAENYVSKMLEAIEENGADIAICQLKVKNFRINRILMYYGYSCVLCPKGRAILPNSVNHYTHVISHMPHGKIIRKSLITSNKLYFSETESINDILFFTSALICAKSVVLLDDHLVTYNHHRNPHSISSRRGHYPQDIVTVFRELYTWLEKKELTESLMSDYCLKWSITIKNYSHHYESDTLISCITDVLMNEMPWKSMDGRQLRQKSQLYAGFAEHTLKLFRKKLKKRNLSTEARASLEKQILYAERELHVYSEIIRILRDEYGKDMRAADNYLSARLNQIRQTGLSATFQIIYRKLLNRCNF